MSLNTQNYQNIKPLLRNYVKIERVRITSAFLVVIEFLLGLLYILDFITFSEKALSIYLVIIFLSIVILSTAQFLKSKTVQRVEKNNDK
jgi:hypothetical protein